MTGVAAMEPDAQLMVRLRAGETGCFDLLLDRHRKGLVHFIYRMVGSQGVAEELAQEVFLRVYRARQTYEPTAKFTTWLYRIATHLTLNWLRSHGREKHQEYLDRAAAGRTNAVKLRDPSPTAEQTMVRESTYAEIRRAIETLPDNQRAAVVMHKYHGMEYALIAKALNCTDSAVKSLLFRAYETLRSRLAHMA